MAFSYYLLALVVVLSKVDLQTTSDCTVSNDFVLQVNCTEKDVKKLAEKYGFRYVSKVFEDDNIYHWVHPNISRCSQLKNDEHVELLQQDSNVLWVKQQEYREHELRHVQVWASNAVANVRVPAAQPQPQANSVTFNDPCYRDQWYLFNEGQTGSPPGNDLNVMPAWNAGFTGKGVTLSVLDDGIQHTNRDIHRNYEPAVSYDLVDPEIKKRDPMPDGNPYNSHGTYCAGAIAAVANNDFCGIGVAYNAKVGGIRVVDGPVTDLQEALALSLSLDKVDVFSASWGPKDDGKHISGPGELATRAFAKGIEKGRNGKGAIYVWAVGNGGNNQDNCNLDGYVSNMYTLSVSALADSGLSTYYSEPCASTLASVYVGGPHELPKSDSDLKNEYKKVKVVVPSINGECLKKFQGTSAAAPLAAGVIALLLEANPSVTWLDVQHIVVETARIPATSETGWQVNSAGYHFHLMYGFGVMDAGLIVQLAQKWINIGPQITWFIKPIKATRSIYANTTSSLVYTVSPPPDSDKVSTLNYLEYVVLTIAIHHPSRGKLEIFVTSPSGTKSQLLTQRSVDMSKSGIHKWDFLSAHFWGENPLGNWTLTVHDTTSNMSNDKTGTMKLLSMKLYGTADSWPFMHVYLPNKLGSSYFPNSTELNAIFEEEIHRSRTLNLTPKVLELADFTKSGNTSQSQYHRSLEPETPVFSEEPNGQITSKKKAFNIKTEDGIYDIMDLPSLVDNPKSLEVKESLFEILNNLEDEDKTFSALRKLCKKYRTNCRKFLKKIKDRSWKTHPQTVNELKQKVQLLSHYLAEDVPDVIDKNSVETSDYSERV